MKRLFAYEWFIPIQAFSALILVSVLGLQYGWGLEPCYLCLLQRIPYTLFLFLPLIHKTIVKETFDLGWSAAILAMIGAAIAGYHVGVEGGWWSSAVCSTASTPNDFQAFKESILSQTRSVSCADVGWSVFGISLAGYNMILFCLIAGYSLFWLAYPKKLYERTQRASQTPT